MRKSLPWDTIDTAEDKFKEECGVFAVSNHDDAAALTALGLHALQHRGQEACGIVTYNGEDFHAKRGLGLVQDKLSKESVIESLPGRLAIGHNRYSTSGTPVLRNVQPLFADLSFGGLSVAHNGNLTNAYKIRQDLVMQGALFQSTSDTEVIIHLIARSKHSKLEDRLVEALKQIQGAYSLVALGQDKIIGVRDPFGVRPLVLGQLGESYILASETCALDIIGAELVRDIDPGEMVVIENGKLSSHRPFTQQDSRFCIFEYIYFSRPDTTHDHKYVYDVRKKIGEELALESPAEGADIVVPVPDSGVPAALGYAQASGVPFELGIIRNHYVGRTFIEPTDQIRHLGVKLKHNASKSFIDGKSVVLVDDSIVRGTTSKKIVDMVRQAGAKEVHFRVSSPPTTHSCFYGIDTPDQEKLIAHNHSTQEIAEMIGADSLAYISIEGLYRAVRNDQKDEDRKYCDACFTGKYAIELTDKNEYHSDAKVSHLNERAMKK